jgi:arsenical resistance protein ArsH
MIAESLSKQSHKPRILFLYGSLRARSFSRLLAEEGERIISEMGAETRIYNPFELPMHSSVPDTHPKVTELRSLSEWSEVNTLRLLGRWMRMITIPNQSSVAKAYEQFEEDGRMKDSPYRDRLIDVMEELYKFTLLTRDHSAFLTDRHSERKAP